MFSFSDLNLSGLMEIARIGVNLIETYRNENGHKTPVAFDDMDQQKKDHYVDTVKFHLENPEATPQDAYEEYQQACNDNGNTIDNWDELPAFKRVELGLVGTLANSLAASPAVKAQKVSGDFKAPQDAEKGETVSATAPGSESPADQLEEMDQETKEALIEQGHDLGVNPSTTK